MIRDVIENTKGLSSLKGHTPNETQVIKSQEKV